MEKRTNQNIELFDLHSVINLFVENWIFFMFSLIIAVGIAFGVNKYSNPIYKVNTSLLINEEGSGFTNASAQLLNEIGFVAPSNNFTNEIIVLSSESLIIDVLQILNFDVSYFQNGMLYKKELYKSCPFVVIWEREHPQAIDCDFHIKIKKNGKYDISIDEENVAIHSFISNQNIIDKTHLVFEKENLSFGTNIYSENFKFKLLIDKNFDFKTMENTNFSFRINTRMGMLNYYQSKLQVIPHALNSTVALISMESSVPSKDIDFLNGLTKAYLNRDVDHKKHTYIKTVEYIDDQLNEVQKSLELAEEDLQSFRSNQQVINISFQAEQIYNELNDLKNEKAVLIVNQKYVNYILKYFEENKLYSDLITPSTMGIDDPTLNNLVEELIRLNTEKASFIENEQEKSPYLNKINVRIDNLRNLIIENIKYIRKTTNITLDDLNSRIDQLNKEIRQMPETERQLTGIERIFNINDVIYTYLLEKKSEAEIAEAAYQPDAEILQNAKVIGYKPISPKTNMNYAIALFLGLIIPFAFLRIKTFMEPSIINADEISHHSSLPVLGKIFHNNYDEEDIISLYPNSRITESFRKLQINLKFFIKKKTGNTILVTSSISSEGKSFLAYNLASMLSNSGKKSVLVGFDLRKPRLYRSSDKLDSKTGLSSFLVNQAKIDDIIKRTKRENFDIILCGTIPPNPSKLIISDKKKELFEYLKENYDYVILDSPPLGPISDSYILMEDSDLMVFTTRINRTPKKELREISEEIISRNIEACIVINDIPSKGSSRYGYGYYNTEKN